MSKQDQHKQAVASAALAYVEDDALIGVGTGSTANYFIDGLAEMKSRIDGAVASSEASAARLRERGIPLLELNAVSELAIYVDGADECNAHGHLIKGGGGALTREKIVAQASRQFICIVDHTKLVNRLGQFPLPVEVIPMARSLVAREMVKLGGSPMWRDGFVTDNGNYILDVHNLNINNPVELECQINNMPGVVTNGLFALRPADLILVADDDGIRQLPSAASRQARPKR